MGSAGKAWTEAASIGAVEALKDHGFCRWNYTIRSINQHAINNFRSTSQANKLSSSSSSSSSGNKMRESRKAEESLRTVMYLSCWGPNN